MGKISGNYRFIDCLNKRDFSMVETLPCFKNRYPLVCAETARKLLEKIYFDFD